MRKLVSVLDRIEDFVLISMFAAMVTVIFVQVIMRYIFNNSLSWSEELGKFFFVWISWIGISIGARRNEHIRITMLVDRLPFRAARSLLLLAEVVVLGICVITAYYGVILVQTQSTVRYAGIRISISWGYLSVVVGCVLMSLRCVISMVTAVGDISRGAPAPESAASAAQSAAAKEAR